MSPQSRTIVAMASEAGSTGKTTTLVTLAALLAEEGKRVLVIDTDPQANASKWLALAPHERTLSDVLLRRCTLDEAVAASENTPGVFGVAATNEMAATTVQLQAIRGGEQRLRRALEESAADYDVVLIDCAGTANVITTGALVAATSVMTASYPTRKEAEGVLAFESTVTDTAEDYRLDIALDAVILSNVPPANAGAIYIAGQQALRDAYPESLSPAVRRAVTAAEALAVQIPLPIYAPTAPVTQDYRAVLVWLHERGVL